MCNTNEKKVSVTSICEHCHTQLNYHEDDCLCTEERRHEEEEAREMAGYIDQMYTLPPMTDDEFNSWCDWEYAEVHCHICGGYHETSECGL